MSSKQQGHAVNVGAQKKRGRKAVSCPDSAALLAAYAADTRLAIVARQLGCNSKQVRRWLGELGVVLPVRVFRRHGDIPAYTRVALTPHGRRVTCRLYAVWDKMKKRCHRPGDVDFYHYGARGISVCDEWRNDYAAFRSWAIANGYRKGLTLDRIDGDGHYTPANCRWATREEQTYNTRSVYRLTLNGVTKLLPEWARELGLSMEILRVRKRSGWPDHHALTVPKGGRCPGFPYQRPGRKPASDAGATK